MGARGDKFLRRIDELREPTIKAGGARVSEGRRGAIVRRRLRPPEWTLSEFASSSQPSSFVGIPFTRRRHERRREREQREK